jgi:hypothetical protein
MAALFKGQEDITAHDNGDVADDSLKIPQLGLSFQVERVLQHLEKHLDVPPFAIDVDDFLVSKVDLGREDGRKRLSDPTHRITQGQLLRF